MDNQALEEWPGAKGEAARTRAEELIEELERTGGYKILRRVPDITEYRASTGRERRGLMIDVETTGLKWRTDRVIELALVLFTYEPRSGKICRIEDVYSGYEDPESPISAEITKLTGITDDMVAGQRLDDARISSILAKADIVLAHNAEFDRPFAENRIPSFALKPWACSLADVPWKEEYDMKSKNLEWLLYSCLGQFYEAHRAFDDCKATIHLLASEIADNPVTPFEQVLVNARKPRVMVWAVDSPFQSKDELKEEQYKWFEGNDTVPKCWRKMIDEADMEKEIRWLENDVYRGKKTNKILVTECPRTIAYSDRVGRAIEQRKPEAQARLL